MQKLVFTQSIEDVVRAGIFFNEHSPAARKSRLITYVAQALAAAGLGTILGFEMDLPYLGIVGVAGAFAALVAMTSRYTWKWWGARTYRKMLTEGRGAVEPGESTLEISESGLHAEGSRASTVYKLGSLTEIREDETRYYIMIDGTHVMPIPKTGAISGDADAFVAEVRRLCPELG